MRAPAHLGPAGRRLFKDVTEEHTELGAEQRRLLEDACREADLIERLEVDLRTSGLTVRGSQGQQVSSPLVSELRQHRSVLATIMKSMRLPLSTAEKARAEQDISENMRKAARVKWDKIRAA